MASEEDLPVTSTVLEPDSPESAIDEDCGYPAGSFACRLFHHDPTRF